MMGREEAFLEEISSQCSSGCQSGWTLYLDHSAGSGQQQCRSLPYQPDVRRQILLQSESDEEDSMVSDASSGPPPHPRDDEELQEVQDRSMLPRHRRVSGDDHCYYSSSGGRRGSASVYGSRSSGLGQVKSRKKRRTVVQREKTAMRRHGVDDDLHDTASSSAVAPLDVVEAMHRGEDVTDLPSCALSAKQYSPEWPAVRRTAMQAYAMLHHN